MSSRCSRISTQPVLVRDSVLRQFRGLSQLKKNPVLISPESYLSSRSLLSQYRELLPFKTLSPSPVKRVVPVQEFPLSPTPFPFPSSPLPSASRGKKGVRWAQDRAVPLSHQRSSPRFPFFPLFSFLFPRSLFSLFSPLFLFPGSQQTTSHNPSRPPISCGGKG
jgi:hypothetical protein